MADGRWGIQAIMPRESRQIAAPFQVLGQRPYSPGSPAGWPDTADHWGGSDALLKRIEWSNALAERLGAGPEGPFARAAIALEHLCLNAASKLRLLRTRGRRTATQPTAAEPSEEAVAAERLDAVAAARAPRTP